MHAGPGAVDPTLRGGAFPVRIVRAVALTVLLLAAGPLSGACARSAAAQTGSTRSASAPAATSLDEIEAMVDAGRLVAAREALARWFSAEEARASRSELVRARFLRARLTRDADSAEIEYLWVAIDGGAPHGAAAWLRLAQLHLARGEPDRARQELERMRAEYPESSLVAESWLWSGRVEEALGDLDAACDAWRRAAREAGGGGSAAEVGVRAEEARSACDRSGLRYTVQLGAFRARDGAEGLRRRARDRGFEVRIERAEGLLKVRVGRFASIESARVMAERLRRSGFSAVIVSGGE